MRIASANLQLGETVSDNFAELGHCADIPSLLNFVYLFSRSNIFKHAANGKDGYAWAERCT